MSFYHRTVGAPPLVQLLPRHKGRKFQCSLATSARCHKRSKSHRNLRRSDAPVTNFVQTAHSRADVVLFGYSNKFWLVLLFLVVVRGMAIVFCWQIAVVDIARVIVAALVLIYSHGQFFVRGKTSQPVCESLMFFPGFYTVKKLQ